MARKKQPTRLATSPLAATSRRRHKFHANPTTVDGKRFASTREANRYKQLKILAQAGKIENLRCQVPFELIMKVRYFADFVYIDPHTGEEVIEDVKGYRTPEYKRKKKLMAEQYSIDIRET